MYFRFFKIFTVLCFLLVNFTSLFAEVIALELRGDWVLEGSFKEYGGYPTSYESIDSIQLNENGILLFGSWSGSDDNKGYCISPEFTTPQVLSLYISGSFHETNCRLYLEDVNDKTNFDLEITTQRHILNYELYQWELPDNWKSKVVRLIAEDNAIGWGAWIGISSPFIKTDSLDCNNTHIEYLGIGSSKYQDHLSNQILSKNNIEDVKFNSILSLIEHNISLLSFIVLLTLIVLGFYLFSDFRRKIFYFTTGFLLFLLFLIRLPGVLHGASHLDEVQMLTQAMTLYHYDFAFWRSVDGTTGGPLLSYILIIPHLFGLSFSVFSARLVGVVLIMFSIYLSGLATKNLCDIDTAKVQNSILLVVFAFLYSGPLIHYTSEHLPIFVFSLSYYLLSKIFLLDFPKAKYHIFGFGLLSILAFFTKLQVVPLIFGLNIWFLYWLFFKKFKKAYSIIFTYLLGFGLILFVLIGYLLFFDLVEPFYAMYIKNNILIKAHQVQNMFKDLEEWYLLFFQEGVYYDELAWFFRSCMFLFLGFFIITFLLKSFLKPNKSNGILSLKTINFNLLFVLLILLLAVFAVIRPGRMGLAAKTSWGHYLLFIVIPGAMFCAFLYFQGIRHLNKKIESWVSLGLKLLLFIFIVIKIEMYLDYGDSLSDIRFNNPYINQLSNSHNSYLKTEGKILTHFNKEYDPLAIWGYNYDVYIQTKLTQATRDGSDWYMSTKYSPVLPEEITSYHKKQYLRDLKRSKPRTFIDFTNEEFRGINDLEIVNYIECNYHLIYKNDYRAIYLRNDLNFYTSGKS